MYFLPRPRTSRFSEDPCRLASKLCCSGRGQPFVQGCSSSALGHRRFDRGTHSLATPASGNRNYFLPWMTSDCPAYCLLALLPSAARGVLTRSAEDEISESSAGLQSLLSGQLGPLRYSALRIPAASTSRVPNFVFST